MTYTVKEIYYTLQGEGVQAGRPAVFLRFAGCNLWSGLERDRASAVCRFCDTDFRGTDGPGGGKFETAVALAEAVDATWPGEGRPYVVCTGGEPLLQLDAPLIDALHARGFEIGVESNGTIEAPTLLPVGAAVGHLETTTVDAETAIAVGHGRILSVEVLGATGPGPWAVCDDDGELLAVYEAHPKGAKPTVVIPR